MLLVLYRYHHLEKCSYVCQMNALTKDIGDSLSSKSAFVLGLISTFIPVTFFSTSIVKYPFTLLIANKTQNGTRINMVTRSTTTTIEEEIRTTTRESTIYNQVFSQTIDIQS